MVQPTSEMQRYYGAPAWLIPLIGGLLGVLAGVLFFFDLVPLSISGLIALAVFALLAIALHVALNVHNANLCCLRKFTLWTVASALGLLTLAIYTLGVTFVSGSIMLAILFGAISTLYFMTVMSVLFTIICLHR